jgi:TRAP transporter TAXI family solute receptor
VRRERLSLEDSVAALKERKVDAFFWVGGAPTPAIAQLAATAGIRIRLLDHGDAVPEMTKRFGPLYVRYVIPARAYPGMSRDVSIAGVWNILVASDKMSDQVAYEVVKAIFDHKAELVAAHREAENISLEWQRNNASPIPFHPGAIRYFAEKGIKLK